jgi:hypothetical protein
LAAPSIFVSAFPTCNHKVCLNELKVSEMNAEYFAPREDFILQNEAPSDFYILVTGSVVKIKTKHALFQLMITEKHKKLTLTCEW